MYITVKSLRALIKEALIESDGMRLKPQIRNALSDDLADREQIARNSVKDVTDDQVITSHLQEPLETKEDCYGPVPPEAEDPYVIQDPYAKWATVLPTPRIMR